MAPFNNRQIGYIQAIAGRQQHTTLIAGTVDHRISSKGRPSFIISGNEVKAGGTYTVDGETVTNDMSDQDKPMALAVKQVYGCGQTEDAYDPNASDADNCWSTAKSLLIHNYTLGPSEIGFDSRGEHNNDAMEPEDYVQLKGVGYGTGNYTSLPVFEAPIQGTHHLFDDHGNGPTGGQHVGGTAGSYGELVRNQERIPSNARATEDGFLNSTDVKFRFTLPVDITLSSTSQPMGQNHYEFRWIVFRNKRPTIGEFDDTGSTNLEAIRDGKSFRNYSYDFFMSQTGRKRGLLGFTHNAKLDKEKFPNSVDGERYSGFRVNDDKDDFTSGGTNLTAVTPPECDELTVDDLMTMRINRDDYVVMKDVRFFLGKEHGKSHFEDHLHWDWNDPIETPYSDVLSSPTLNNKNYRWKMMLIGTNGGAQSHTELNVSCRWTTKMESG